MKKNKVKVRPLIAILRGISPDKTIEIVDNLINSGIKIIEIPLNSPKPFLSIEKMCEKFKYKALLGAGTVTNINQVNDLHKIGCEIIISPNTDKNVIRKTKELGMISVPGVFTASEFYNAINYGADGLKIFPASVLKHDGFKAISAVLPQNLKVFAVGGVKTNHFRKWIDSGITGFGIGSSLFNYNTISAEIKIKASNFVNEFDKVSKNKYITF